MRAWQVKEFGAFEDTLELREIPRPVPLPNGALVRVRAAGVNFPDALAIGGQYQVKPELPFTPGFEAMGEVIDKGAECKEFQVGERVICWTDFGAFKDYICVPCEHMFRVPASMPDADAAGFLISYQTAFFSLVHRARIQPGDVLLIHGGAGAVGSAAIQMGKALGVKVIATASVPKKVDICLSMGADYAIDRSKEHFDEAVMDWTGGHGASIILDTIGGDEILKRNLSCIAWEGRLIPLGFTSGAIPKIGANRILLRNIAIVGLYWSEYWRHDSAHIHDAQRKLNVLYEEGAIRPLIGTTFRMDELPKALGTFHDRCNYGKRILVMQP